MGRIIINFDDDINDISALKYVEAIIMNGRMSGQNKESYCYCTMFKDNTMGFADVTKSGTDVFRIQKGD